MSDTPLFLTVLKIDRPAVGLYDTPDIGAFSPIAPKPKRCFFAHYENWMEGGLHTPDTGSLRLPRLRSLALGCVDAGSGRDA